MRAGLQRTPAKIVLAGDSDLGAQGRAGGHREGLRRTDGDAAGIQLGTALVDRQAGNVGSARRRPPGGGQARRQLLAFGRGGAFVVVGARESRAQGEGRQRACRVWLEGQEVPGEYRDAVDCGYCESSAHRRPSRKRSGARGEPGAGMTGTPGSEVRAGETDRRQRQHRAPARPYGRRVMRLADRLLIRRVVRR
jgi:hypothetical protein